MSMDHIYLASASPRRRELLEQIGVGYTLIGAEIDESPRPGETPEALVERLALEKARAGLAARPAGDRVPVLGADTLVVLDGRPLGKPAGRAEALQMLAALSGRAHQVLSAVALVTEAREAVRLNRSRVWFRDIGEAEREAYWESGEPADKAGGYAIQGLGALFVERIEGSYSGIMGLPLFETARLLQDFGIRLL